MKKSVFLLVLGFFLIPSCGGNGGRGGQDSLDESFSITPELTEALTDYDVRGIGDSFFVISPVPGKNEKMYSQRMGCMDIHGKMLLPVQYESLFPAGGNLLIARKPLEKNFGAINLKGKTVIPFKYETLVLRGDYLIARQNGRYGILDKKGTVAVPLEYDDIKPFYEEYGILGPAYDYEAVFYLERNGDVQVINLSRAGGSVSAHENTPYDYQRIKRNGLYGYVNYLGEEIPCQFEDASETFSEGLAAVVKNGRIGFIDTQGNVKIPFQFEYSADAFHYYSILGYGVFSDGYASMRRGKKFGAIDKEGKDVIPYVYDEAFHFERGVALALKQPADDKFIYGVIDKDNHVILPFEFEGTFQVGRVLMMTKNGKTGVYALDGKCLLPCQYDWFSPYAPDGYIQVTKGKKQGLVNDQGREVIPCQYDLCEYDRGSRLVRVKLNGKYGWLDVENRVVVPVEFDSVATLHKGLFSVAKDGKTGLYDLHGHCTLD